MAEDTLKNQIMQNAAELNRLHLCIHETFRIRDQNPENYRAWQQACEAFHSSYDKLAFPGGYNGVFARILSGDPDTMEAPICFLECRPYFFRSGYMFERLIKKAKRAPLLESQTSRLHVILEKLSKVKNAKSTK